MVDIFVTAGHVLIFPILAMLCLTLMVLDGWNAWDGVDVEV
jgi:hypothetical protein